jgi:predicted O-methyltransferase YrrM
MNAARVAAASVDGWLNDEQGAALFAAAAGCSGRGAIVEIGSWKGRSTIWLAHGARLAGQPLFAVDPHVHSREDPSARTLDEFSENIRRAGVADVVRALVMTSSDAARRFEGGVEVLFIDGDHSDAGAEQDAAAWLPRLIEGATVMFHDVVTASYTGPRKVFRRHICWNPGFAEVRRIGSMGVARRVGRRSRSEALRGTIGGFLLYMLDAKRALRKVWKA